MSLHDLSKMWLRQINFCSSATQTFTGFLLVNCNYLSRKYLFLIFKKNSVPIEDFNKATHRKWLLSSWFLSDSSLSGIPLCCLFLPFYIISFSLLVWLLANYSSSSFPRSLSTLMLPLLHVMAERTIKRTQSLSVYLWLKKGQGLYLLRYRSAFVSDNAEFTEVCHFFWLLLQYQASLICCCCGRQQHV